VAEESNLLFVATELGIPWAIALGNHCSEGDLSRNEIVRLDQTHSLSLTAGVRSSALLGPLGTTPLLTPTSVVVVVVVVVVLLLLLLLLFGCFSCLPALLPVANSIAHNSKPHRHTDLLL